MKLTEAKIRNAKPRVSKTTGKPTDHWISDGGGLYLRVLPSGRKGWWIRRKLHGKALPPKHIGNYPDVGLKQARHDATGYALKKNASTATMTDLVTRYRLDILSHHKRPRFYEGYINRAILPALASRRVADIETAELVTMIQNYGTSKRGTTGERARDQFRNVLKQMFGLAVELGWRDTNPAVDITNRVTGYTYIPKSRIVTCDEVRLLWADKSTNARVCRFLLLTGVRIGEAQQGEPDKATGGIWDIHPDLLGKRQRRSGNTVEKLKPHRVYLTEMAQDQLPLPACSPTNVQAWLRRWCDRHGIEDRFTPHDLRRTFSTWLNEDGVEPYVVEKCLDHKMEGMMAVYNHADYYSERKAAYAEMEEVIKSITT